MESVQEVYTRSLLDHERLLAALRTAHRRLGIAKAVLFLLTAAAAILLLHSGYLPALIVPIVLFVLLALWHNRVIRRARHQTRVAEFYRRGLARMEDRWPGTGSSGDCFLDPAHPYARDLDLFGSGSLFELLANARTRSGEETLAGWLLSPAPPEEVRSRQRAVADLKGRLPFRERLFAAGESARQGIHPDELAAWGEQPPALSFPGATLLLLFLSALWLAALAWWTAGTALRLTESAWFTGWPWDLVIILTLINYAVSYALNRRAAQGAGAVEQAAADLGVLAEVLAVIEQEPFTDPRLCVLRESFTRDQVRASVAIRRLGRIVEYLEARRNFIAQLLNVVVFYNAHLVLAAERWQRAFGPSIRGWLASVGEIEALADLGGYAFEHPADVWPEFTEGSCFEAEALAHPLLPAARAVRNDLDLNSAAQLVIVSGPNMAGKSTFLRGIGLNAVLAQSGAPVRAARLRLSPLAVGASICVLDSLQGGVSRFYAEIKRLKLLSDLARGPLPLLFLLDELLSGTNSHDRLEGTRHIVQSLVRAGAIGLITTHDLALTAIPDALNGAARNAHFEDAVKDGQLLFDYRLKPGIVRTSNALKLMYAIGLDIPTPDGVPAPEQEAEISSSKLGHPGAHPPLSS